MAGDVCMLCKHLVGRDLGGFTVIKGTMTEIKQLSNTPATQTEHTIKKHESSWKEVEVLQS